MWSISQTFVAVKPIAQSSYSFIDFIQMWKGGQSKKENVDL